MSKTRTAPWDYARLVLPPTRAEYEAEKVATCPKCDAPALPIDLPGRGVHCDTCGIQPLSEGDPLAFEKWLVKRAKEIRDPRSTQERDQDELAADEAATIKSLRPGL